MQNKTTVERAFELARSGSYAGVTEIARQLAIEGYSAAQEHLAGPTIKRQLLAMCRAARPGSG